MQVATTTPQTSRWLLAVGPDMVKVLTVVALRKSKSDDYMVQAIQLEHLLRF
jgi:hypothetical protein